MNPIYINSPNVVQFGFYSSFMLEDSSLLLDTTTLTVYKPGGQANVIGICFEVIDPSGTFLSTIDWTNPAIVPSTGDLTYSVSLSGYPSMFGWYKIRGVLRDQDGQDYQVVVPPVQICKPVGFTEGGIPAVITDMVDCSTPKVGISDNTNYSYLGKLPFAQVKEGMFYYPQGTLAAIPFSYTPFAVYGSGKVYTGTYTVRIKVESTYDMGNYTYVVIAATASYEFTVTCTSNLCQILCCVEKLQDTIATQCNTAAATDAQTRLAKATIPLIMAITEEKCGTPSDETIADLLNILNCDCNCDGMSVEPSPIFTAFSPTVLQGLCGTNVTYDTPTGTWLIRSQTITLSQTSTTTQSITISQTSTDCNVNWNISVNLDTLTGEILNTIANSPTYLALFNSLVIQQGLDLSQLGQNCVINVTNCNYSLTLDAANTTVTIINVLINGTLYLAPPLIITNAIGIASWLNSLALGTWNVNYDPVAKKTLITTNSNPNDISTMTLALNGVQLAYQFIKSCGSILSVIKAILDYLCGITDAQVALSQDYSICTLQADGTVRTATISPGNGTNVATMFQELTVAICTSLQNIAARSAVSCAAIKAAFTDKTSAINTTLDVLYGTRGSTPTVPGNCGTLLWSEIATALFTYMVNTNDQNVINLFCQVKDRCFTPVCNPVQASTIELIQPCPGIAAITGAFTT